VYLTSAKYCPDLHTLTMLKLPEEMAINVVLWRCSAGQEAQKEGNLVSPQSPLTLPNVELRNIPRYRKTEGPFNGITLMCVQSTLSTDCGL
jgi:hypothetical protein